LRSNKKVLVIDDDIHILRVIELKLKNRGYEVLTARDGKEGLTIINTQQPDVVITDINMPKLDGKSLCEQTNALKKQRPFLTVVITSRVVPNDKIWVEKLDHTLFMEKPFSLAKLGEAVDGYFEASE